jgi:cytochrome c-type biogenesis protein CcmH
MRWPLILLIMLPLPTVAQNVPSAAALANTQLPNPAQERTARALMDSIRCLVCQGQSIADSDAALAGDMRALIRKRIAAGETPDSVRTWLVGRYGRWVSYEPSLDRVSWPLWAAPILLLSMGALLVRRVLRGRRA